MTATSARTESGAALTPYHLRQHRRRWATWASPLIAALAALGWPGLSPSDDDRHWMLIARDSNYSISLDTTRIARDYDRVYEVWYRTDHSETRYYRDKTFDRETVKIQIACHPPSFKVVSTTLWLRGRGRAMHQEDTRSDVLRQPWHAVDPGTTDADAANATCIVADARWRAR